MDLKDIIKDKKLFKKQLHGQFGGVNVVNDLISMQIDEFKVKNNISHKF